MDVTKAAVIVIIVLIFALLIIVVSLLFRKYIIAEINAPFGLKLKLRGANSSNSQKPGISVKGITSREGGILAEETTGHGIEIENVDVKDDVLLSSINGLKQNVNPQPHANTEQQLNNQIDAKMLNAGGDITIQQFVGSRITLDQQVAFFMNQIGLENLRTDKFATSQYNSYCEVWKKLQALRLAGDDLWDKASQINIVKFAKYLRETKSIVYEGEIFFDDRDRKDLLDILHVFEGYHLGKIGLIEVRTKKDITSKSYIDEDQIEREIKEQIFHNFNYKIQYGQLLEKILISFRSRLSHL